MTTFKLVKSGCLIVVIVFSTLVTSGQLHTDFSATPLSGCSPLVVRFTDLSTGNPTQWKWDLGNGTISFLQNPSVTYFTPGLYSIKLVIRNGNGKDSLVRLQYISVYSEPTVRFGANVQNGCYPLPVHFTDSSSAGTGGIIQWQWDFGDGQNSVLQNPTHVYTNSGNYNVSLRVTNSNGCTKAYTHLQYIQIFSGVTTSFSHSTPNSCVPPVNINFTNTSTGTGSLTYLWNFGDGFTSTDEDPSHIYTTPGSYNVTLIAVNSSGCSDTAFQAHTVTIGLINSNFNNTTPACENSPVLFTNTSVPAPTSSLWSFGDATTSNQINPIKIYAAPGNYTVRLINNFGSCKDTIIRTISVIAKPHAGFNANNVLSCKTPFIVNFENTSTGATSYQWFFGDGTTSSDVDPVHAYQVADTFSVTLIAYNPNGCTDTLTLTDLIKIQLPEAHILNLPQQGCAPFSNIFTSTSTSTEPVTSWLWDFGDGTNSTDEIPTHVFDSGVYNISLIITTASGCTDTTTVIGGIKAGIHPVPVFYADPLDACAHYPINFTDSSTGQPDQWLWYFGDGGSSSVQNPSHHYSDTGWFDIHLFVWNNGCEDSLFVPAMIHITPPIAKFNFAFSCDSALVRQFTDQSIGADTWTWDFGDGTTSTEQNPSHTFPASGIYTTMLIVSNFITGCTDTAYANIQIISENADFNASETNVCKRANVIFTSTANSFNILTYQWSFGDGTTGTGNPVSHTYTATGIYTVSLIITTTVGCTDTLIRPQYIHVNGPLASFSAPSVITCSSSTIVFNDSSVPDGINPITQWIWNYGDGIIDTLLGGPFTHLYNLSGIYNVSLTVSDQSGCRDIFTSSSAVTISRPKALFRSIDTVTCPNSIVHFINSSTGTSLTYKWSFGDGGSSLIKNPAYAYPADGVYSVKLKVTDNHGCVDSITKPNYIKALSPTSVFSVSDTLGTCPPLVVNFTNNSSNFTSIEWDFGDGTGSNVAAPTHFYSVPGVYFAKLTTKKLSCTAISIKRIVVQGPSGSFHYNNFLGCTPLTVNFIGTTVGRISFIWDFSDGTTIPTTDSIMAHVYTIPGVYVPKMILVDSTGCVVPVVGTDTIVVKGVTADFRMDLTTLCSPGIVQFTDTSRGTDPIVNYSWIFGDGQTGSVQNPTHSYTLNGIYYPKLKVTTSFGCTDTITSPTPVKVIQTPRGSFTQSPDGCVPLLANFNGIHLNPDTSAISWNWDFGNGQFSNIQTPTDLLFNIAGNYNVKLIIRNSRGCADTVQSVIKAYPVPDIQINSDTALCIGSNLQIQATGAGTYSWSPATGLNCTNCPSPIAAPDSATTYYVTGTSNFGCSGRDSIHINVWPSFTMRALNGDSMCFGSSRQLIASGAPIYQWSPVEGLSNPNIPNPIASPSVTTIYTVTGTDPHHCFTQFAQVPIKVFPIPTVEAGEDITINVGQTIDLMPRISSDVIEAIWTPTGSGFRNNFPGISVKPKETTTYTVSVKNSGGCTSSDFVTVHVICNGANVFIPNTFSPNNDGANDVFYPRGSGLFSIKTMKVFNRWGEIVYQKNDFMPNDSRAGWDGNYKGKPLNSDVYVYIIEVMCDNNTSLPLKGNVTLVK